MRQLDERTIATRQRWMAIGGGILGIGLSFDLIVRSLVLKQDFSQYWDLFLMWFATVILLSFGMARSGVAPYGEPKWGRQSWLAVVLIAIEVPLILAFMGMIPSVAEFAIYVALAAVSATLVLLIVRGSYTKWEKKIPGDQEPM